jgi:hypothetical protein
MAMTSKHIPNQRSIHEVASLINLYVAENTALDAALALAASRAQ